jgi:uncharacterized membrane protein
LDLANKVAVVTGAASGIGLGLVQRLLAEGMSVAMADVELAALEPVVPVFVCYALSFVYVAIYWNNHHHMLHAAGAVNGAILWANLHLLFWLSLIPFVTGWMGENHFAPLPVAMYGAVLLLSAISYYILSRTLIRHDGGKSRIAQALGSDFKGRISVVMYAIAIPLSFASRWVAVALYAAVAAMWLVPDRRIERTLSE